MQANGILCGHLTGSSCYFHILHFQNCSNISAKSLQQQLEALELDSRDWSAKAKEYEQVLACSLEYCTTRECWRPELAIQMVVNCHEITNEFFFPEHVTLKASWDDKIKKKELGF